MLKAVEGYWGFSSETNRDAVSCYPQTRAPPLGHRPFSISVVNSFEGNFVWMPSLFTHQFQAKPCRCSRRVASIIERIDLDWASNLMGVIISLTAP